MILKDRVAVITAAGSGIGRACAEIMAREGAYVVVTDIDRDRADAVLEAIVRSGGSGEARALDVANDDDLVGLVNSVVSRRGRIDILHNHAGLQVGGDLESVSAERFDASWAVNVHAQMRPANWSFLICGNKVAA